MQEETAAEKARAEEEEIRRALEQEVRLAAEEAAQIANVGSSAVRMRRRELKECHVEENAGD